MLINFKVIGMRKTLLVGMMLPFAAFAQNMVNVGSEKEAHNGNTQDVNAKVVQFEKKDKVLNPVDAKLERLFSTTVIGETNYDLQVNGSLANRVINHGDGKVSCVFTMSNLDGPYLDRGTGYAHFDGTSWTEMPLSRLEDDRAGWCNIGVVQKDGSPVEFIISHHASSDAEANSGGFFLMMNDGIGSTNWSIVNKYKVAENGPFWPRAVGIGNYIHVWTAASTKTAKKYEGIRRPNSYYRYDASTDEWIDEKMLMDQYTEEYIANGQSDAYQMDASGNSIAIVTGGSGQNLFLFKSDDNGDTWNTTVVDSFPMKRFDGNTPTEIGDTLETNSGSVEVLLDNDGNAHVWWSYNRILDEGADDSTWSYFPGSNGIVYWNEITAEAAIVAQMPDVDGDGGVSVPQSNYTGDATETARYSNNTLACFPDAAIDEDGNIYLIYSAPNETSPSPDGPLFRDVFVTFTLDNGATWTTPQNIIEGTETEDVFAHIAHTVDDKLHIMWQRDEYPGTVVINEHTPEVSEIMYAGIDKSIVLNEELTYDRTSISNSPVLNASYGVYPNPTSGESFIRLTLNQTSDVRVRLHNLTGQELSSKNVGTIEEGKHHIALPTQNLSNGVYIYSIEIDGISHSGRVIVE